MIETYDFIGFGIAAALYFNKVFFPANDPRSLVASWRRRISSA